MERGMRGAKDVERMGGGLGVKGEVQGAVKAGSRLTVVSALRALDS